MNINPLPIKNPYKGPAFFTSDDEGIFHGRKQETRDLVSMVSTERVVLFYAQSGAGKTSLLNAGLIPKLRRKRYEVLPRSRVIGAPYVPDGVRNIFTYNVMLHLVEGDANPEQLQQLTLSDFLWHLSTTDGKDYFYDPSDEAMRLAVPKQKLWPPTTPRTGAIDLTSSANWTRHCSQIHCCASSSHCALTMFRTWNDGAVCCNMDCAPAITCSC